MSIVFFVLLQPIVGLAYALVDERVSSSEAILGLGLNLAICWGVWVGRRGWWIGALVLNAWTLLFSLPVLSYDLPSGLLAFGGGTALLALLLVRGSRAWVATVSP